MHSDAVTRTSEGLNPAPDPATGASAGIDRPGRPPVGRHMLKARIPPWILAQLDALTAERTRQRQDAAAQLGITSEKASRTVSRAEVTRDVLVAGLVALKREGVTAPGFGPGRALLDARRRGEPT